MTSTKDSYDCSHKHRGYALIFANEDVEPIRIGALEDEMIMKDLFSHLKFRVIHRSDVSKDDIVQTLNEVLADEEFLKNSDCFVVVISTHGKEIRSADGKTYQHLSCTNKSSITTQKIVNMVSKCKALEGKPKLFFIQACRVRGKVDRNTQEGRDPGHIFYVKKEDSHDETNESPKHSSAQLSVGHTMNVRSDEEARQKLENLVVNCDGDQGNTIVSQNSASATTDEDSQLSANVKIGQSLQESSFPKSTAVASQNLASATTDEDSKLSIAMKSMECPISTNSSLLEDAGQISASTTNQASKDPVIHHFIYPKDTLIMYAVPPGYIARRRSDGVICLSVMLEELFNVLKNIPEETPLLTALTQVQGNVAKNYEYSLELSDCKVEKLTEEERRKTTLYKIVPVVDHRLLYEFYFTKKDDCKKDD